MNRLWWDPAEQLIVRDQVRKLAAWYQPIRLPGLIFTRPWNRETVAQWIRCERGNRKLNRFILPMLPVPILGATVLELGTSAAGNLVWACKHGASSCVGVEVNDRYFQQAKLVVSLNGLTDRIQLIHSNVTQQPFPASWDFNEFTYCWMLNFLYHVPKEWRVPVLQWMGDVAQYVVLQGNGLADKGRGDGWSSLMRLIEQAGLQVHSARCEAHVRGLVVIAKGSA